MAISEPMFSPPVAKAIAFVVAAAVFIGLMTLAAVGAGFFSEWIGEHTRGWPAWATLGTVLVGITALYSLGLWSYRRDQKADRANR